ncbi:MAG: MerR family transcriptional regulator [Actinomycetia bacterium]|nr:MerR family transcriptional regulator [Actinomycetes bacterium]
MSSYLTIGEVVQRLKREFTDLSVSKLRYLEDEGLIEPGRTESGYRQFTLADVERITLILRLQEQYFLPLSVINKKLREHEMGGQVPEIEALLGNTRGTVPEARPQPVSAVLDMIEASRLTKAPESFIRELQDFGIIATEQLASGRGVSGSDLDCVRAAWGLRSVGVEPRHLRMYVTFADREALIYEQFLRPTYRHKTPESRARLKEHLDAIDEYTRILKANLFHRALHDKLTDLL